MGLRVAVVTRLARGQRAPVVELERLGVAARVADSRQPTCLELVYEGNDPDRRTIRVTSLCDPLTAEDVAPVEARAFHVGATFSGEVPLDVVRALAAKRAYLSLDAQGYVRAIRDGELRTEPWPESREVLPWLDLFKVDAAEAKAMTGVCDLYAAIGQLARLGPREVLLTHSDGVLLWAGGRVYAEPFVARSLQGRTGRGDTCVSAYLSRRLLGEPPEVAVKWAAAVTSLKIEVPGPFARPLAEAEALLRERYV